MGVIEQLQAGNTESGCIVVAHSVLLHAIEQEYVPFIMKKFITWHEDNGFEIKFRQPPTPLRNASVVYIATFLRECALIRTHTLLSGNQLTPLTYAPGLTGPGRIFVFEDRLHQEWFSVDFMSSIVAEVTDVILQNVVEVCWTTFAAWIQMILPYLHIVPFLLRYTCTSLSISARPRNGYGIPRWNPLSVGHDRGSLHTTACYRTACKATPAHSLPGVAAEARPACTAKRIAATPLTSFCTLAPDNSRLRPESTLSLQLLPSPSPFPRSRKITTYSTKIFTSPSAQIPVCFRDELAVINIYLIFFVLIK